MSLNDNFFKSIDQLIQNIQYSTQRGLYNINQDILKNRISNSKERKTGREYKIFKNGRLIKTHVASKKNIEGDARLTGHLNDNTKFAVSTSESVFGIDTKVEYADFIQNTRQSLVKAAKEPISKLQNYIEAELENGFKNFK